MIELRSQSALFGGLARDLIASGNSFCFCARGRSMNPTIQDGDIVWVEPFTRPPRVGEIVLFFHDGEYKAHRVVGKAGGNLITRGDAGRQADGLVRPEEIVGRVTARECPASGQRQRFGEWERLAFGTSKSLRRALRPFRTWWPANPPAVAKFGIGTRAQNEATLERAPQTKVSSSETQAR